MTHLYKGSVEFDVNKLLEACDAGGVLFYKEETVISIITYKFKASGDNIFTHRVEGRDITPLIEKRGVSFINLNVESIQQAIEALPIVEMEFVHDNWERIKKKE